MIFIIQLACVGLRGTVESIAKREGSRPRSALRFQTPPLQRRTHRTPGCAPLKRRRHSPARSTCADAFGVRSSPLGADMVGKSRNMSADMFFTPGLLALIQPTICCVRSQSVRDFVTEISGGATPAPWLRARALSSRPKLGPASSIVTSWCPCVWAVVWLLAAHPHTAAHPSIQIDKAVPFTL